MLGGDARDSDDDGHSMIGGHVRDERRERAWIGASIVIKGDLTSSEDMTIAGRVEGDVTVRDHTLVVAPRARIHGDIIAGAVAVHGQVTGTITAAGKVELGETGSVNGDIIAPRMAVTEGAVVNGRLEVARPSARPSRAG